MQSTSELRDVLFTAMADGVLIVDMQGVIVDCNPAFCNRLGYGKDELLGKTVKSLDTPEHADRVPERIAWILRDGEATFETALYRKDGTVLSVELNSRLFEADGQHFIFSIVRDISERKSLEADLKKNYEIYHAAINTPALGFWVVDMQGQFLEVNDAYIQQSGYSRAELLNMRIPDIEAIERPEETAARIEKLMRTGYDRFRSAHRRKDGSVWPVEIVVTVSKAQGGMMVVFVEDIEEKVAQENRLAQATRVYEAMDQAVVVTDGDNKIVSINPATTTITGYSLDELQGKDPKIFASGRHDRTFYAEMWGSLIETGHWAGEIWDKRKDGEIYVKHLTINVIHDERGKVSQYVSVFSDITHRKQAEIELIEAYDELEERVADRTKALSAEIAIRRRTETDLRKLSRAVEHSAHMIFITNFNGVIEYINPKFTEWLGYTAEEAIGQKPSMIKSGDTPDEVYSELWQTILAGNEWHGEIKDRRKDGSIFWASAAIAPVRDENDAITHFIAVHENITTRKEAEQAMLDARRAAEVANKAKTDLMANMSHELRTPLNAIIGFSESMKCSVFGPLNNEHYEEYAGFIHSSGTHLLQLINDILDVSAVEADKLELREEVTDVCEICDIAIQILRPKAENSKILVQSIHTPNFPLLFADPLRLKQIFINLISNAVKFTLPNGTVSCNAFIDDEGCMVVNVTDSGIGMDEAGIEKALEKFGQVDSSLSRTYEGTGLGLPLTKGLIELHGGTMELASELGKGTTITVRFPAERVVSLNA
ncbi:MAG: PAS domain S-box protein [Rhodospirillales bacterium]|nr:PAS domain S-box protein [Rhodospirillales bacterium]